MSKSYQNLLFAFLFLLGPLLSPTMSQMLPGASCPKGKVMVCCYGTPFTCYAWNWPCEDHEVEQCCKKTNVCIVQYNTRTFSPAIYKLDESKRKKTVV